MFINFIPYCIRFTINRIQKGNLFGQNGIQKDKGLDLVAEHPHVNFAEYPRWGGGAVHRPQCGSKLWHRFEIPNYFSIKRKFVLFLGYKTFVTAVFPVNG